MSYSLILSTVGSLREAKAIAKQLISSRRAACVNVIPDLQSYFWWKGKTDRARECLLVIKTKNSYYKKVESIVKRLHSYEVPEILRIPIRSGLKSYLKWIDASVR